MARGTLSARAGSEHPSTMAIGGKTIDGLHPQLPATHAAAIALRHRLDPIARLLKLATGRGKESAEHVHQLRVATRRAAAALDAFADLLEPPALGRVRKRLTRIRRAASGVRESDVALAALLKRRKKSEGPELAALDCLIAETQRQRTSARRKVAKAADRYPTAKLRRAHRKLLRPLGADAAPALSSPTLLDIADATIDAYLSALRHAAGSDLRVLENVHELRIEVKRLRYGLELFDPCLERASAEEAYTRLANLQDRLGDINDASQLLERLESAAADLEIDDNPDTTAAREGMQQLIETCRDDLAAAHGSFLSDWSHGEVAALADRLRTLTAHEPADDSAPPDRADHRTGNGRAGGPASAAPAPDAETSSGIDHTPRQPARHAPSIRADHDPRRFAAIDVGTNSIRLIIAEADAADSAGDHSYRILDDEKDIARLGRGLDATGLMDPAAMERAATIIARMRGIAAGYGVSDLRVVGTAVVREAGNGDEFVSLVRDRAGVELEVISAEEEAKLAFLSASHAFDLAAVPTAVVDIGGGSTEVVLSAGGVVERVYLIPLGAVRLTERFGGPELAATERFDEMTAAIRAAFRDVIGKPPFVPQVLIGTGGTFAALGNLAMHADLGPAVDGLFAGSVQGYEVRRWEVRHLLEHLRSLTPKERERVPGLSPDRADIIVAGLALADGLMKRLEVNRALVHEGGIRDGLLLQMVGRTGSASAPAAARDPMRSVMRFARMCGYEHRHCDHIAALATQIFDRLAAEGPTADPALFTPRNRFLLEAAAIVHDVGYLINYSGHHKHSYHLIVHADLPGLTAREVEIVANLARYHRRGEPDRDHRNYGKLAREDRAVVSGLAAILRIADGLDRTHTQRISAVRIVVTDGEARFMVESAEEPEVDLWGAVRKCDLFEKRFGLKAKFEWAGPPVLSTSRASQASPAPASSPTPEAAPRAELILPPDFVSAQPHQ